jgi:hypothetical protein
MINVSAALKFDCATLRFVPNTTKRGSLLLGCELSGPESQNNRESAPTQLALISRMTSRELMLGYLAIDVDNVMEHSHLIRSLTGNVPNDLLDRWVIGEAIERFRIVYQDHV